MKGECGLYCAGLKTKSTGPDWAHLESHLGRLPPADSASKAVVEQMKLDEARHASQAVDAGAAEIPAPAKALMRVASRVMTTVAHRI